MKHTEIAEAFSPLPPGSAPEAMQQHALNSIASSLGKIEQHLKKLANSAAAIAVKVK